VTGDGTRLFVANSQSDDVTVIDASNGSAIATVKVGRSPHSIVIDD
jgi:YVTN family beta-propeller protein